MENQKFHFFYFEVYGAWLKIICTPSSKTSHMPSGAMCHPDSSKNIRYIYIYNQIFSLSTPGNNSKLHSAKSPTSMPIAVK